MRHDALALAALVPSVLAAAGHAQETRETDWPSFRGRFARGVAEGFALPESWDGASGKNVAWSREVPGLAHSSPVVHGDRLFVTTAVRKDGEAELSSLYGSPGYGAGESVADEGEHAFLVLCLDKRTGELLWERTAFEGVPAIKRHPKSTHANATPAADEARVVAFFGSEGLHCFDHDGKELWRRDFGRLDAGPSDVADAQGFEWGFASSPVLHAGRVVVQCDVRGESFVAVLDAATGEDVWRRKRDEAATWCTPTVYAPAEGRAQVLCNGYRHIGAYDFLSGEELWKLVGGGDVPVPTPVVADGLVFLTSAHGRLRPLTAVEVGARGTLVRDPRACRGMRWSHDNKGIYMQTPLVYGVELYACADGGVLSCFDAATGAEHYRERLGSGESGFSGSAVAGDGKLYFSGENGEVHVVLPGPDFEVLAVNDMGETLMATPALSAGRIYFRTRHRVVAVAGE